MRMSKPPKSLSLKFATNSLMDAKDDKSSFMNSAFRLPMSASILFTASVATFKIVLNPFTTQLQTLPLFSSLHAKMTWAPNFAKVFAVSKPIPVLEPAEAMNTPTSLPKNKDL